MQVLCLRVIRDVHVGDTINYNAVNTEYIWQPLYIGNLMIMFTDINDCMILHLKKQADVTNIINLEL